MSGTSVVSMIRTALTALACVTGAACDAGRNAPSSAQRTCGVATPTLVTGSGIGALRIGARTRDIRRLCDVASDSTAKDARAVPQRVMRVRIGGGIVVADIVRDSVWRLTITDSTLRTSDGLGVGTTLASLVEMPGVSGINGDGAVFVVLKPRCGLSFGLDHRADNLFYRGLTIDRSVLLSAEPSTQVDRIVVFGCARSTPSAIG